MTTLCNAVNTTFTPAVGSFNVQVASGGVACLEREQTSGAGWAAVGNVQAGQAFVVDNPVSGAVYRFSTVSGTPVVQADQ